MSAEPLRILHLIKGLGLGGAESCLLNGLREADRQRFHMSYGYFLEHKSALAGPLREQGAEVTLIRAGSSARILLASRRTARLVRAARADLIHAHLPISGVTGRIAGRLAGVPVVYTEHSLHERQHPWTRFVNRRTWSLQAHVIVVSEAVGTSVRALASPVPTTVIPNGVPIDDLRAEPEAAESFRARLGVETDVPLIGQIAIFRPEKRLDRWLEAAAKIVTRRPESRFVLVGDGPQREELEARARQLGLRDSLSFTGLVEDVRPALAAMDLLLVSSQFEGLPLTLLEAMAMGRPVVSTPAGGIPEALVDGETGLLARGGSAGELAELVVGLIDDPERLRRYGRAAAARAEKHFSARAMQRQTESVYLEVLGR